MFKGDSFVTFSSGIFVRLDIQQGSFIRRGDEKNDCSVMSCDELTNRPLNPNRQRQHRGRRITNNDHTRTREFVRVRNTW